MGVGSGNFVKKTGQKGLIWALFGKLLDFGLLKVTIF